jgi:hypothetical protein
MSAGRFASRANMGYPFAVPNDESFVLSANKMKPKGFPFGGKADYTIQINVLLMA